MFCMFDWDITKYDIEFIAKRYLLYSRSEIRVVKSTTATYLDRIRI